MASKKTQNDYNKTWRNKNPDKLNAQKARYALRHPDKIREKQRKSKIKKKVRELISDEYALSIYRKKHKTMGDVLKMVEEESCQKEKQ